MLKSVFLALGFIAATMTAPAWAAPAAPAHDKAYASVVPQYVLVAADRREKVSLSGPWHWSVDPYKDGLADFHGRAYDVTKGRGSDVDVEAATRANPDLLFEYDLKRSKEGPVPSAWVSYDPTLRYYNGQMWYQKSFRLTVPAGKRAFLRFGAVDYRALVYLNGKRVGEHEGGFTPFGFEITNLLRAGENNLVVGVDSTRDANTIPPTVTDWETYGGIIRDVDVVITPDTFIDDAFVRLTKAGRIEADLALEGPAKANRAVAVRIGDSGLILKGTTDADGRVSLSAVAPRKLKRWSPETPTLYDVVMTAGDDTLTDPVGFRTIEVRGTDIILNGKPVFLRGICLHEEELGPNPARVMTEASSEVLLREIKEGLNGNFVRLAHYPHTEVTTRLADRLGLLVWSEIPVYWSVNWSNPATQKAAQTMMAENILRDRNRASVIIWSVGNETPVSDPRNAFLTALAQEARALDGSRLVSAALLSSRKDIDGQINVTIDDPLIPQLDVLAINTYIGWYGNDKLDAVRKTVWHSQWNKPLIFSEFGAEALYGVHDPETNKRFSEEYQADFYKATLEMADNVPFMRGTAPWILKDFRSPRRQNPIYQNGWNRKGVISETGQRKMAFKVLADYYKGKMD